MASKPIPDSTRASTATKENPLRLVEAQGQAVWLDYIRRSILSGGDLKRLVEEDGLSGVTSNPTIFEKAIAGGEFRDGRRLALRSYRRERYSERRRYSSSCIRSHQGRGWIYQPGSFAEVGARYGWNYSRGAAVVEGCWAAQLDD